MEVKPGYKQTEVGVIPDLWNVQPINQIVERLVAGVSVNSVNEDLKVHAHRESVLKTSAVCEGRFLPHECKKIAPSDLKRAQLTARKDTIIISRMNTPELVGECGYVENDEVHLYLPDRLWMTKQRRGSEASIRWLSYLLSHQPQRARIRELATGTSGSMKNLSKGSFLGLRIPFPPPLEQRAIATALSDVDGLLGGLDQLIAKKRDLKQAAMQQLLTGQTRLPGFKGEWKVRRLGDLGAPYGGLTGKNKADFGVGSARYVTFMNVMTNVVIDCGAFERVKVAPTESQNRVAKGDLLFNGSSETPEEVAMCAVMMQDVPSLFLNSFCFGFRFRDDSEADGVFLAYYLRSKEGRELMKSLAQGSTRYNLSKAALLKSPLRLPELPEQTAIAGVLADMDAELAALEQRRAKTRALKQAMMQDLLTGRVRLL